MQKRHTHIHTETDQCCTLYTGDNYYVIPAYG